MEAPSKKSKSLIPKQAQVPLAVVGVALLAYFGWDTANRMGWVGGPPKAKTPVAAKQPPPPPGGGAAPTAAAPTTPGGGAPPGTAPASGRLAEAPTTNLDALRAPGRDPMAELNAPPAATTATPPPTAPGGASTPPPTTSEPPPLPPPMPTPGGAQPGFPSPTVGGAPPAAVPAAAAPRPVPHTLPPSMTVTYPLARRGGRAQASSPVTVLGTISGNRGSLAVVHPGNAARGQYVKPGDTVAGSGARIESITSGAVKIGNRGGSREVSVRARRPVPAEQPKPEAAPATPEASVDNPSPAPE
jgi:hypothetical protein